MEDETEINSSDVEIGSPRKNRFHAAGLESVNAIIDNAASDRMTSKRAQKRLVFTEASSKTQYLTELWHNRFATFRSYTLKQSLKTTPVGFDIERFLHSVVSKSQTRRDVPSLTWLKGGLERLLPKLSFDYADFKLSKNESTRLKSTIRSMLQDGIITDEPTREANWVGAILIRRIIVSSITEAAIAGCFNWDKIVQRVLRNVLMAALSCRIGDIMSDALDDDKYPFLYYDDIVMKLVDGKSLNNLEALVSIRNEKRMGKTKKKVRVVFLQCLQSQEDNPLCAIKWLLISALRLGALREKSLEDVLKATAARRDKTVQWAPERGKSPVLCAFKNHWIDITKSGNVHQPKLLIRAEGLKAGLLAPIIMHDLRRGAARDMAHLPSSDSVGMPSEEVAAAMGHSEAARTSGVTKKYIGYTRVDNWAKRVRAGFDDPFGVTIAPVPYKPRKRSRAEWVQVYADAGVDPSNYKETFNLRAKIRKREQQEWIQGERGPAAPRLQADNDPQGNSQGDEESQAGHQGTRDEEDEDAYEDEGSDEDEDAYEDEGNDEDEDAYEDEGSDEEENLIDPILRGNIADILVGSSDLEPSEEIAQDVFDEVENPIALPSEFDLPGPDFVKFMSQINVVRNGKDAARGFSVRYRGNSRAEPTPFLYKCTKTVKCEFTSPLPCNMRVHEHRCTSAGVTMKSKPKRFACTHEGCNKAYTTTSGLRGHISVKHKWNTRFCKKDDCDGTVGYTSEPKFSRHMRTAHSRWESRDCPVRGCCHDRKFATKATLRVHMIAVHDISSKMCAEHYGLNDNKRRQEDGGEDNIDGSADGDEEVEMES